MLRRKLAQTGQTSYVEETEEDKALETISKMTGELTSVGAHVVHTSPKRT